LFGAAKSWFPRGQVLGSRSIFRLAADLGLHSQAHLAPVVAFGSQSMHSFFGGCKTHSEFFDLCTLDFIFLALSSSTKARWWILHFLLVIRCDCAARFVSPVFCGYLGLAREVFDKIHVRL
jgi:hypothetical protein